MSERRWLVLADGYLDKRNAKTAHGVIRYSDDAIAAVLDRDNAGTALAEVMPELGRDAPIVASVEEGLRYEPTSLLLGVATPGGWMPEEWRAWIIDALRAGLEIVNGLHTFLRDDPEFVKLAAQHDARLWDVRDPPSGIPLFSGKTLEAPQKIVLTVGSDCAVGKKTTAIELTAAARAAGMKAEFVATGQTGIMIAGRGIAVDRVVADFVAGAAEKLVVESDPNSDVVVVEGQGSLWHPAYSGVTLGLLHGSSPHVLVLCHEVGRSAIEEPPYSALPTLNVMRVTYESLASVVRPAKVACIALNCKGLDDGAARRAIADVEEEANVPAGDVTRGDAPKLWAAVETALNDA
ncbi:MAG: DUF1611 domain-containing protein [Actinomycetota bacterium]|nr:DUF1611 domain-containing protein [Actinomycetota bacterium]